MNKKYVKKQVLILIMIAVVFLYPSCVTISVYNNGYDNLSEKEKEQIELTESNFSICDLLNERIIYSINGLQLKECLEKNDTSVVYIWSPNCGSEDCILVSSCQDYCTEHNYSFYVVAEYYDFPIMEGQNASITPMFTINSQYYQTENSKKNKKLFLNDLISANFSMKEYGYGRYLFFKSDQLIIVKDNLLIGK